MQDDGTSTLTPIENGFQDFNHGAADVILAAEFNLYGTHLAVCSADHKIRLFAVGLADAWTLIDQWRGHDAEILDVRWIGPSLGHAFGTIGDDNKFKIWREDSSQAPQSGRRFRCIFSQSPSSYVSYASFDFRTVKHDVWLMLMGRDGLLSLLEPSEPESLHNWREVDTVYPYGQQTRGTELKFRLSLHQAEMPCYGALNAGLDPKAISVCISAHNSIKVFRATRTDDGPYRFFEMLEINIVASAINDVAWAPGSIRPHDLIAAGCDDSCVRIYAISMSQSSQTSLTSSGSGQEIPSKQSALLVNRQVQSGIGAGLAGISSVGSIRRFDGEVRLQHFWKEIAVLPQEVGSPVWRVRWTHDGSTITSTGDSGRLHLWKQNLSGGFVEFAEAGPAWNR